MTVYVEAGFLLALAKDTDWLPGSAEEALAEYDETNIHARKYVSGSITLGVKQPLRGDAN